MSRIVTRRGDDGYTTITGAERTAKSDRRIEGLGCIDELNAYLGFALSLVRQEADSCAITTRIGDELVWVQQQLLASGTTLVCPAAASSSRCIGLGREQIGRLEAWIQTMEGLLPPLDGFLLPQGAPPAAALHVARVNCRRLERVLVALRQAEDMPPQDCPGLAFVNRLSDYLFVAAYALQEHLPCRACC